uniref:Uncharacterized protein n=1 Tax=Romanomermis culicivorax TaxID=13658 RepID=A0A915ICZ0_ROMCU
MTDSNLQPNRTGRQLPFRSVTLYRFLSVPFRSAEKRVTSNKPDSSSTPSTMSSIYESTIMITHDYRDSTKSGNGDDDRTIDNKYGSSSTGGSTESTTTPVVSERRKPDTSQMPKMTDISVKSESQVWDNFFGKEAAKNNKLAYEVTAQDALLYVAQTESQDVLSNMSYELKDIFVAGMFNSRRLAMSKIKKEHYPGVGNCFTFNNEGPYYMNAQPGRQRG